MLETSIEENKEEKDPLLEQFGPGSAVPGTYTDPEEDADAPEELLYAYAEHGLSDMKSYRCLVRQVVAGSQAQPVVASFSSCYPSIDWMKKNCGPGDYELVFMWRSAKEYTDETGNVARSPKGKRFQSAKIQVSISDKCRQEYLDYQLELRLEKLKVNRHKIRDAQVEKILEMQAGEIDLGDGKAGEKTDQIAAAKDYVKQTIETANMLGLTQRKGIEWDKILPVLMGAVPIVIKFMSDAEARRDAQNAQMLTLLTTMSQSNNHQLVEVLKAQGGQGSGQQMIKEFSEMVRGAFDLKEMMKPEQETVADKLFRMIEGIAPHIASVMMMKEQQRQNDPRFIMAQGYMQNSPDFAALKQNPLELKKFIDHLDEFFGWEQTDTILKVGKIERPANCPRDPAKQYPPQEPETAVETAAEVVSQ